MLNQCSFIGNLGADVEVRRTQDGRSIANFSLGVTEKWRSKDTGEQKSKTEWVRVVIFNEGLSKLAEQYLRRGSKIYITGKLQTRSWEDQSGVKKYTSEIVLQNFDSKLVMLDGPKDNQNQDPSHNPSGGDYGKASGGSYNPSQSYQAPLGDDAEIPF